MRPRETLVVDALSEVIDLLSRMKDSVHIWQLRAQANTYANAVKRWSAIPPTEVQVRAMFELVTELHAKMLTAPS